MNSPFLFNRNFVLLCANNFFQFLTHFLMVSTLPLFVTRNLRGSVEDVGMVVSAYLLTALVMRPLTGKWIDEFDKQRLLRLASLGFSLPFCLYPFVTDTTLLLLLRALHGVGFGMLNTASIAIVSGTVPPQRIGEGMGYYSLSLTVGSVIGPMSGLYMIDIFDFNFLFKLCCLIAVSVIICCWSVTLPQSGGNKRPAKLNWRQFIEPAAIPLGTIGGLIGFAYTGVVAFITIYTPTVGLFDYTPLFFFTAALTILISRPFIGRAFDRFATKYIIYPAFICFAAGLIMISRADSGAQLLFSAFILGLGNGTLFSCLQALLIRQTPSNRRGVATSTFFIFFDGSISLGAMTLGSLSTAIGYQNMYVLCAMIGLVAAGRYYLASRQTPPAASSN